MEVLGFNGNPNEMELATEFISDSMVIGLEEAIVLRTISLRRQQKIKLPDAIIAATAIVHQLTLVTRNIEDFKNIPGLTVVEPVTL